MFWRSFLSLFLKRIQLNAKPLRDFHLCFLTKFRENSINMVDNHQPEWNEEKPLDGKRPTPGHVWTA